MLSIRLILSLCIQMPLAVCNRCDASAEKIINYIEQYSVILLTLKLIIFYIQRIFASMICRKNIIVI